MQKIKVVTDSTADIPKELVEELEITVVPLKVHFDTETFHDGVNITSQQFYEKLPHQLPTTSQPSPMDFTAVYQQLAKQGIKEIVSIHLSSALSGTYQSAMLSKEQLKDHQIKIALYDSRTATFGLGMIVTAVAKAAKEGKSLDECLAIAKKVRENQVLLAYIDTLEYLQKGGRIGKASALLGSLLKVKPIISLDDEGKVDAIDKARGRKKAEARIFELLADKIPKGSSISVGMLCSTREEEVTAWLQKLKDIYQVEEQIISMVGPTVGAHAGPATGFVVYPLNEE